MAFVTKVGWALTEDSALPVSGVPETVKNIVELVVVAVAIDEALLVTPIAVELGTVSSRF
jgi:hypothetical protein